MYYYGTIDVPNGIRKQRRDSFPVIYMHVECICDFVFTLLHSVSRSVIHIRILFWSILISCMMLFGGLVIGRMHIIMDVGYPPELFFLK